MEGTTRETRADETHRMRRLLGEAWHSLHQANLEIEGLKNTIAVLEREVAGLRAMEVVSRAFEEATAMLSTTRRT